MFYSDTKTVVAKKTHVCTNCGQRIEVGESYKKWTSVDDCWFTSKLHVECYESLAEDGPFEYTPYNGERPSK